MNGSNEWHQSIDSLACMLRASADPAVASQKAWRKSKTPESQKLRPEAAIIMGILSTLLVMTAFRMAESIDGL